MSSPDAASISMMQIPAARLAGGNRRARHRPPGMDGYELASRLRDMHAGMRLIVLTGYGQAGDLKAAIAAGFDAHCAKPVTITRLLEHIEGRKAF